MRYLVGVGSSHPQAHAYIREAQGLLSGATQLSFLAASPIYKNPGIGCQHPITFHNACFAIESKIEPAALWFLLSSIERRLGRIRPYLNAPRTLDLDVLWCSHNPIVTPWLTIPHPRLGERAFAQKTANEAALNAGWVDSFFR